MDNNNISARDAIDCHLSALIDAIKCSHYSAVSENADAISKIAYYLSIKEQEEKPSI